MNPLDGDLIGVVQINGASFNVEWFPGKDGQFYVRVRHARNGKTLLTSEAYVSGYNARRAARKIARALKGASVKGVQRTR